jgi:putative inorganic carbon (hco3(-)) transporter
MGTGLGHYIPLVAYLGFWVAAIMSLTGRPIAGLYYCMPFLPYRTLRDRFAGYPFDTNMVSIVLVCTLIGAMLKGKKPPASKIFLFWVMLGLYCYLSMWFGTILGHEPAPLWTGDANFAAWKDYMTLPLLFVAASMVLEERRQIRTVILLTAASVFLVDRNALLESLSHSWAVFDENKRTAGPLEYGPNQLAAFLAQFSMFFWVCARMIPRFKAKIVLYALTGLTLLTTLYAFSRAAYIAVLVGAAVFVLVKERKLLPVLALFMITWQAVVPAAVTERVQMTQTGGKLDESAQERVDLWQQSEDIFLQDPIFGAGFASFEYGEHRASLKDTHNYFVKVLTETGLVGFLLFAGLVVLMMKSSWQLYRRTTDPLYAGLGLGLFIATITSMVANAFGDRWTYLEINGLLWILMGAMVRARAMVTEEVSSPTGATPRLARHHGLPEPRRWAPSTT